MLLIKQFDDNDCGAACIAMICNHYKSFNTITHIRQIAGTDTQGTSLKGLVSAGKTLGFDTKAVKGIINDTSFYDRRNKNKILIPRMKATARVKGQDPSILDLYNLRVKNKGSITAHLSTLQQSQVKNSIPNVIRSTILFQTWKVKISKRTVNWFWKNNP